MDYGVIEASYPIQFRKDDAKKLGEQLSRAQNVELIGMRRVGISNFLRFFLYHKAVQQTYVDGKKHLFIPVDLNDLVEREIFPFWTLTLKRIVDTSSHTKLPLTMKKEIESLFVSGIQSQDLFLLIDAIRKTMQLLIAKGYQPTLFFLRFDRIKDAATPAFFDNLQGLRDATNLKLSYVFTSYRRLSDLTPSVFTKSATAGFIYPLFIKPAEKKDMARILDSLTKKYQLHLSKPMEELLLSAASGNVQYLHLSLILLKEKGEKADPDDFLKLLSSDERIRLQSEELFESLSDGEKETLLHILQNQQITQTERQRADYLFQSGMVKEERGQYVVFSDLFVRYLIGLGEKHEIDIHFTKKEHRLFTLLEEAVGKVRTRDEIIEVVWPESVEFGVSDWAIDRLVARVRTKLKQQASPYEIVTIRTRGYTLQKK